MLLFKILTFKSLTLKSQEKLFKEAQAKESNGKRVRVSDDDLPTKSKKPKGKDYEQASLKIE